LGAKIRLVQNITKEIGFARLAKKGKTWNMVLSICKKGKQTFGIARNSSIFAAEY
jgi:hypothetical protein